MDAPVKNELENGKRQEKNIKTKKGKILIKSKK